MSRDVLVVAVVLSVVAVGQMPKSPAVPGEAKAAPGGARAPAGGASVPAGVKRIADLEYARVGEKKLLLDLYLPEKAEGALPVVVGIHGGGWATGSKAGGQGSFLAARGFAVAVISYRLSGEAPFPAQIEDCKSAVRWLRANAAKYNLNPDRIGATGHSAGGHLTSLLAVTGDVKDFDKGDHLEFSSRIQAAAPSAGPTDFLQMDAHAPAGARLKHDAENSPEARLIGGPIQDNKDKVARANPITFVSKDDPPFLIVHGDQDATVPYHQAQLLFEALKSAGVPVHLHTVKGGGHGLGSREANDRIAVFFERQLQGTGSAETPKVETSESTGTHAPPGGANPGGANPGGANPGGANPGNRPLPPGLSWDRVREREDANSDGKVTRDEWKGPKPLFDRLDRNGDGVLTPDDFEAAAPAKAEQKTQPKPTPKSDG